MASLQELLAEEGPKLERGKFSKNRRSEKLRQRREPHESVALPIYICHDRQSFDISKEKTKKTAAKNGSSLFSSKRVGSVSERSNTKSRLSEGSSRDEPAIDEVAIRAVISVLTGYVGRYVKDVNFREALREKCKYCLEREKKEPDNEIFLNVELGIESIEKLVEYQGTSNELRMKTLKSSIRLLSIVDSLNSEKFKSGSTCGTPNSPHLSACAQLYLAIAHKLEKNDRISARHLLRVFCHSPFLARTYLLPDLWEHFFLPHLLHLKIWYTKELESLTNSDYGNKEKHMKALSKEYNDQMDKGTTDFALYYKGWLKVGVETPPLPTVPLPSKPSYGSSKRRSSDSYSPSSMNGNLYRAVFGPTLERRSLDLADQNAASIDTRESEKEVKQCTDGDNCCYFEQIDGTGLSSSQNVRDSRADQLWPKTEKSDYLGFFAHRSLPTETLMVGDNRTKNGSVTKEERTHSRELNRAIHILCSSDILSECEIAIRVISKAWSDSQGDTAIEAALSKASIIEGMMEVLSASNEDQIMELVISLLAELVARNQMIGQIMLNLDPQLQLFTRLLRSSSLFLKAAVLLYLSKPKAKQMVSYEWVPLVLRVSEFGEQLQTLFTKLRECKTGGLSGGVNLLVRGIERGDTHDRSNAASILSCCIRADGSCRNYVVENLNKSSLLELIVFEGPKLSNCCAFALLTELLCLKRRIQMKEFLCGLKEGWSGMNSMHILFGHLQRAPPEQKPLVAAILLQLDLLGDAMKCSVYREEAVEAMIAALDCKICNSEVQEQSARALLMLAGRFSYTGESSAERWLLQQAGFPESTGDSFSNEEVFSDGFLHMSEEEEATEDWQRKVATVLFISGKKRFLVALSDSIANGIPSLARASIITIAWMASFLLSVGDENLQSMACSILVPHLLESMDNGKDLEERVLASYSLQSLIRSSECVAMLSSWDQELLGNLQDLSLVTWTANELISAITCSSRHEQREMQARHRF
ncbi:putative E3 ubiquitin-protein ligase LIN-1 [Morella rubra]|uniref:Putative E3 ubiquitin-protein ligase LIN-1 n=1 Tax=Morella rubra TaxID=262757 RepID=A0A6A1WA73_9ROSI|nr:putative E3 ubiquitin-protein ligase LIN-1 [Morella rubra]